MTELELLEELRVEAVNRDFPVLGWISFFQSYRQSSWAWPATLWPQVEDLRQLDMLEDARVGQAAEKYFDTVGAEMVSRLNDIVDKHRLRVFPTISVGLYVLKGKS